jgi:ribosome biogenesis protein MAK21
MPELQHAGDDSDSIPSGLDEISDDDSDNASESEDSEEDQGSNAEADNDNESVEGGNMSDDLGDSDSQLEFAEDPDDLIELSGGEVSSDEEALRGKRKKSSVAENKREKRRKLPTFASAEDYAKMIDETPADDL